MFILFICCRCHLAVVTAIPLLPSTSFIRTRRTANTMNDTKADPDHNNHESQKPQICETAHCHEIGTFVLSRHNIYINCNFLVNELHYVNEQTAFSTVDTLSNDNARRRENEKSLNLPLLSRNAQGVIRVKNHLILHFSKVSCNSLLFTTSVCWRIPKGS